MLTVKKVKKTKTLLEFIFLALIHRFPKNAMRWIAISSKHFAPMQTFSMSAAFIDLVVTWNCSSTPTFLPEGIFECLFRGQFKISYISKDVHFPGNLMNVTLTTLHLQLYLGGFWHLWRCVHIDLNENSVQSGWLPE